MTHARPILSFIALALLACTPAPTRSQAQDDAPSKQAPPQADPPKQKSATADAQEPDYASFGMPSADAAWSNADFTDAHKALNAIAKADAKLLPRDGSPTFARITDIEHLRTLASSIAPEQLAGLSLSLGMIQMIYGDRVGREPQLEREHLMVTAAVLAVTSKLPVTTASDEAQALALRSEPSRLKGILRFRHGIYEMVTDMLEPAPNSVIARGVACEQLARVIADAAPLLLEEERTEVRERIADCEGASAEAIARLEQALASEAPTAALVTALLPEHREFKQTK